MALWNGSTLNKTTTASMFNQLWDGTVPIARKANGLLYVITGDKWKMSPPETDAKVGRTTRISGDKVEVRLLGRLETVTTVADGAAEMATDTLVWSDDNFGAAVFDLTHYATNFGVPDSEYDRIRGSEAKTKNFVKDKAQIISLSYEKDWGNKLSGTQVGFSRTVLGSWLHAVSDGVTAGEATYATYGTIDRSDATNADFRGYVRAMAGTATLADLTLGRNTMRESGGVTDLLLLATALYSALEVKIQNTQAYTTYDEKWSKFGGQYYKYGGIVAVQEHRMPTTVIGMLDSSTWQLWMDNRGVYDADGMLMLDPSRKATRVIPTRVWMQLLCNHPAANGKLTGVTGIA